MVHVRAPMDRRRPLTDVSNSAPDVSLAPTKRKRTGNVYSMFCTDSHFLFGVCDDAACYLQVKMDSRTLILMNGLDKGGGKGTPP